MPSRPRDTLPANLVIASNEGYEAVLGALEELRGLEVSKRRIEDRGETHRLAEGRGFVDTHAELGPAIDYEALPRDFVKLSSAPIDDGSDGAVAVLDDPGEPGPKKENGAIVSAVCRELAAVARRRAEACGIRGGEVFVVHEPLLRPKTHISPSSNDDERHGQARLRAGREDPGGVDSRLLRALLEIAVG